MKISFVILLVTLTGVSSSALAGCPFALNLNYMLVYMNINNETSNLDVKASKGNVDGDGYKSIELKPKHLKVDHQSEQQGIIDSTWCEGNSDPKASLYIDIVDKKNSSNDICHVVVTLTGGEIAAPSDVVAYPQTDTITCTAVRVDNFVTFTVTLGKKSNGN